MSPRSAVRPGRLGEAEVFGGSKHARMGNGGSQSQPDSPPDAIFQVRVVNAGNSCYLDSVLFAMFAMPCSLDTLLTKQMPSSDISARFKQELQSSISKNFVSRLRAFENVTGEMISNIRLLCRKCGWEYVGAPDQQQDAGEFFSFLHSALNGQQIRLTRRTFTGALPDNSDRGHEENMSLLPVPLHDSQQCNEPLNLSSMLDTWFYENVAAGLRRKVVGQEQEVVALNTYSVENVPCVVAVSLKRFDEMLNKMDTDVRFPSHLNLHKYSSRPEWRSSPIMHSVPWNLRSVVCHRGRATHSGHYYSYTRYSKHEGANSVWLRFDDVGNPCITQANVFTDPYVRSESVLFIYELDIDAHTAALMMLQEEEEEERGMMEAYGAFGSFHQHSVGGFAGSGSQVLLPAQAREEMGRVSPNNNQEEAESLAYAREIASSSSSCAQLPSAHQAHTPESDVARRPPGEGTIEEGQKSDRAVRPPEDKDGAGAQDGKGSLEADKKEKGTACAGDENLQQSNAAEEGKHAQHAQQETKDVDSRSADSPGLVWSLCGSEDGAAHFVVTANRGVPMIPSRAEHLDSNGTKTWCSEMEFESTMDPFVCVSVLKSMDWQALTLPQIMVSVDVEGRQGCAIAQLSASHPSAILNARGGGADFVPSNNPLKATVRIIVPYTR